MIGGPVAELYQIAENEGVEVCHFPMPESESMSLPVGEKSVIGMDNSKPRPASVECVHLGHELGHCLYGGFYSRSTPYDVIGRHEYRADAWFIQRFIPAADLQRMIQKGYTVPEMAEALCVTEDYIKKALHYWTECREVNLNLEQQPEP